MIGELVGHPFTTSCILVLTWVWVKIFVEEWDHAKLSLSYVDCIQQRQYWRLITAPFAHSSPFHLFLNIMLLWSCKDVEEHYGSWFAFRYSLVLAVSESLLTFALIRLTLYFVRSEALNTLLTRIHSSGSSGLVLGWLAFLTLTRKVSSILFLGLFPLHPSTAMLSVIILGYVFTPASNVYANLAGLNCGYLLAIGLLQLLPNTYWSVCFFINLALLCLAVPASPAASSSYREEEGYFEVEMIGTERDVDTAFEGVTDSSSETDASIEAASEQTLRSSPTSTATSAGPSSADSISQRLGSIFRPHSRGGNAPEQEEREPLLSSAV